MAGTVKHMIAGALLAIAAVVSSPAHAEAATDQNDAATAVWQAANAAMLRGPQTVPLQDQATLALPEGYGFVPREPAARLMDVMGNQTGEAFIGLVFPLSEQAWFVTVDYEAAGYIKDDDAKDWDADELLENLREGTEAGNAHRQEIGVEPIAVSRWIEVPSYDAVNRRLVWSAEVRRKNGDDPDPGVNYNTYVLGREGYIAMDLVTAASTVEADKPAARALLGAVNFNEGKRYGDFNASTDKVAAYGLAALVGGLAAKKLGLLAMAAAFFAKFAKIILLALAGAGGGLRAWWKKRSGT